MTVIAMSRTEIDRMSVLQDLATNRIKVAEAATLMGLGRRQVFRLAKAYSQHGLDADDGGAGRIVHACDAQAFMHVALVDRRDGGGDQLTDRYQADALRIIVQAQPPVFADDVYTINVFALGQRYQPSDAGIPLIRGVRQHQRQIVYKFVGRHCSQTTVLKKEIAVVRRLRTTL
jgi:hypothetical protein